MARPKVRLMLFGIALLAAGVTAQPPAAPDPSTLSSFASGPDIQALIVRARREIKPDAALLVQPLLKLQPYTAFLEYRRGAWTAATHPDMEMFFVAEGTGTFISGGQLTGAKTGANGNSSGSGIVGGATRRVGKGDFFIVPAGLPHMFPRPDGELVLISMHVPTAP